MSKTIRNLLIIILIYFALTILFIPVLYLIFFYKTLGVVWLAGLMALSIVLQIAPLIAGIICFILSFKKFRLSNNNSSQLFFSAVILILLYLISRPLLVSLGMTIMSPIHSTFENEKFPHNKINILDIKESPIKNNQGYISNIKFTVVLDPNTPIPDGTYSWNGCTLNSIDSFKAYWPGENKYVDTNQIGMCKGQKAVVINNSFDILLDETYSIGEIVKYKLNGPYLLLMSNKLFDYSQPSTVSVTYELHLKDQKTYDELCGVDNAKIGAGEYEKDKCGETIMRGGKNEYLIINLPYKTNSYKYTQFAGN